jgi:hypothetical protein
MKKTTNVKKVKEVKAELPISLSLKLNDKVKVFKTDNVLDTLRNLGEDPRFLKTLAVFTVEHNGHHFYRNLRIPFMRALLQNDMRRQLLAKQITLALGLSKSNYN